MHECFFCKKKFFKKYKKPKYCSLACSAKGKKKREIRQCLVCKKEIFSVPSTNKRYCSHECADKEIGKNSKKKLTGITIECAFCKCKKYITNSRMKLTKTRKICCSLECKSELLKSGKAGYGFKPICKETNYKEYYPYKTKTINYKRIKEHRWIMENHIGRKLNSTELIHHINGDTQDNRIENLMIVDLKTHGKIEFEIKDRIYK